MATARARRYLQRTVIAVVLATVVGGSFLTLPPSFFSDKSNFLNQYFAKLAWGWTSALILSHLYFGSVDRSSSSSSSSSSQNTITNKLNKPFITLLLQGVLRWTLTTLVWSLLTQRTITHTPILERIFIASGSCSVEVHSLPKICKLNGGEWSGFDVSGHCFILILSILMIIEELNLVQSSSNQKRRTKTRSLTTSMLRNGMLALLTLWWIMLFATAVYFHSFSEKLAGTMIALGVWYLMYEIIFQKIGIRPL